MAMGLLKKWGKVHIAVQHVVRPFPGREMRFGPSVLSGADWLICRDGLKNAIVSLKMTVLNRMIRSIQIVTANERANVSNWNINHA